MPEPEVCIQFYGESTYGSGLKKGKDGKLEPLGSRLLQGLEGGTFTHEGSSFSLEEVKADFYSRATPFRHGKPLSGMGTVVWVSKPDRPMTIYHRTHHGLHTFIIQDEKREAPLPRLRERKDGKGYEVDEKDEVERIYQWDPPQVTQQTSASEGSSSAWSVNHFPHPHSPHVHTFCREA